MNKKPTFDLREKLSTILQNGGIKDKAFIQANIQSISKVPSKREDSPLINDAVLIENTSILSPARVEKMQSGGVVNRLQQKMGYKDNSPYKNLPYQDIYSDRITMSGVSRPLVATTDTGVRTVMQPGGEYYFPGATQVRETPLYSNGGGIKDRENFQKMKLNTYSTPIPKAAEGLSTAVNKKRATTAKSSLNVSAELKDVLKTLGRQFGVRAASLNRMINKIAYHESAGTFDPKLKENTGGKVWDKDNWGAGLFQYKSASVKTAINRAKKFYTRYGKTVPAWLTNLEKSLDIRDLTADQQKVLALLDMAAKPNFSIKNAVKDDDSLAQEWGRGWQTQSDPEKIKKFKQDTNDYNEYVGKEDPADLAETPQPKSVLPGYQVTDKNVGTRGYSNSRQATPMSMDSNMSTTPQSTIQPLSSQAGVDSLSRRTGVYTPKFEGLNDTTDNKVNKQPASKAPINENKSVESEPEFITTSSPRYVNILPQKGDPWEYRYDESTGTWETKRKDSQEWIKLDDSTENKRKAKQAIIDMYGPQLENEVKKARGKETTPPSTGETKPETPTAGTTEAPKTEARTKIEETGTLNPVERRLREWRKKQGITDPSYDYTKATANQQGIEGRYYGQQDPKMAQEWVDKQGQTKTVNQAQAPSQQDRSVPPLPTLPQRNISVESINKNNLNRSNSIPGEEIEEVQQETRDYYGPPYINGGQIQKFNVGGGISKGASTGATLGAALGTVVPGLGNVVGGAVGALVGGIAGGISGASKANKAKREARRQELLQRQANQNSSRQANLLGLVNMLGSGNNNSFSSLLSGPSLESMQQNYYNRSRLAPVLFQEGGDISPAVYANTNNPQTYSLQNNATLFGGFPETPILETASLTYDKAKDKKQEERIVDLYDGNTKTLRRAYVDKDGNFIRWADDVTPSSAAERRVPPLQPLPQRPIQPVQPGQQTPVVPRDRTVPPLPALPPRGGQPVQPIQPEEPVQPGQPTPPEDRTVPPLPTLPPRNVTPAPINPSVPTPTLPWQKIPAQPVQPAEEQPEPPKNRVVEPLPPIAQRPAQPVQPGIPSRPTLPAPTPIQPGEPVQPVAEQPAEEQPTDTQKPPSFRVQEGSYKRVDPRTGQVEDVNPADENTPPSNKENTRSVGIYEFTWGDQDYQVIRDKSGRVYIESNGKVIPYTRPGGKPNFAFQATNEEVMNGIAEDNPDGFDETGRIKQSSLSDFLRQYYWAELRNTGYISSDDFYKGSYTRQKYKDEQVSQQQQGGPIINSLLNRNISRNNSIKSNISMNKSKLQDVINLSNKVNPYRLSPMGVYKNGGLIMEGGVSASRAGFSRQPITGASSTGPLGPKRSEVPSYTNKGVNSIMDLPTNEYVPTENMIPIQAEIGEMIVLPTGDLMPVMARRRHHQMQEDEVTDMTPENSYILSAHGQVRINKDEANLLITETGVKPYRLGQSQNPPTEKTLASVMTKRVMRPAEVAKRINSLFPVLSTDNPFEIAANIENKINRKPYLEGLIQLSELDKYRKGLSEPAMSDLQQQQMQMPQQMPGSPMLARQGRRISRPGVVRAQGGGNTGDGMVTLPPIGPSFIESMYPRQIQMPQPGYSSGYWDAYAQRSQNPSEYLKGSEDTNLFSGIAAPANFAARLIGSQAIRNAEKAGIRRERGIYDQGFGRIGNLMTAGTAAEAAMLGAQDPFVRWTDLPDTYIRSMQTRTPASALEARTASAYANMPNYSEMGQAGLAAQNAAYARALQTGSDYAAQADERDRAAFNEQQRLLQQNLVANVTGRRQAQQATTAAINKMLSGYGNLANRFTQGQIDLTGQRMGANIGLSRAEQASKTGLYQNRLNAFTTFTGDMTAGGAEAFKLLFGG